MTFQTEKMVLKVDVHVFELVRLAVPDCWRQLYWKQRRSELQ